MSNLPQTNKLQEIIAQAQVTQEKALQTMEQQQRAVIDRILTNLELNLKSSLQNVQKDLEDAINNNKQFHQIYAKHKKVGKMLQEIIQRSTENNQKVVFELEDTHKVWKKDIADLMQRQINTQKEQIQSYSTQIQEIIHQEYSNQASMFQAELQRLSQSMTADIQATTERLMAIKRETDMQLSEIIWSHLIMNKKVKMFGFMIYMSTALSLFLLISIYMRG